MGEIGSAVTTFFGNVLLFLRNLVAGIPFIGEEYAWGWAIILLTLIIRVMLLPLAIKQTRSMRAMQRLQPQIKELQKKYKVDRELMRKDPERYRARKEKLNQEMMALYQREGANPLASCLPLLAQAPVFLALFWTLRGYEDLSGAEFYFFTTVGDGGLEMLVSDAGWPGWLLILLMSGTMFWSQKQMMARNAAQMADSPMAQQQKILLYVMPVFLAVISFQFPLGILLYWVTTNVWQVAQQAIILREVEHEAAEDGAQARGSDSSKDTEKNEKDTKKRKAAPPEQDSPPKKPGRSGKGATSGRGSGSEQGGNGATERPEPHEEQQPPRPKKDRGGHLPRRDDGRADGNRSRS